MITTTRTLSDGSTVVVDDADGAEFVLKPGQFEQVQAVKADQQRAVLERLVLQNRTAGDPRSEVDQQAIETGQNAASGESHQESERG